MRCRSRFQCCCHKQEGERILVSKEIAPDEICVRCLLRPLMKQNNTKLRNTTVLPPKSERGVSVLRLRYCDEEFAVKHGKSLKVGNNVFWGLAEFTQKIVDSTNNWAQSDLSKADGIEGVNGIEAHIEYKPMADGEYVNVEKDVFLDDRFGCVLLLDLLKQDLPYDTEFAFVVQEEVGLRGAGVAARTISPDVALIFEATTAADVPDSIGADKVCRLGDGAVISFIDGRTVYDAQLYDLAVKTAEDAGISWQTKTKIAGGNDAGSIQNAGSGVKVLAVSVPCRYLHSPVCVIRESDAEACEKLAYALIPAIQEMGATDDF